MKGIEILSKKGKTKTASVGDIVLSLAGRDRGRLYMVMAVLNGGYVLLTDAKSRRLTEPKLKSVKHLKYIAEADAAFDSEEELTEILGKYRNDFSVLRQRYYKAKRGDYSAEG